MNDSLYIVETKDCYETYQYEYGCLEHAREHLNIEEDGEIYEYRDGKYHFVERK